MGVETFGVPNRSQLEAQIRLRLPSGAEKVIESFEPGVRYYSAPEKELRVGASRFGGAPDLPPGHKWPHWEHPTDGLRALRFFAQIDLAEVAASAPAPTGLPTAGLLSFFADFWMDEEEGGPRGIYGFDWEAAGSTVIYTPPYTPLERLEGPGFGQGICLEPVPKWTWWGYDERELSRDEETALQLIGEQYEEAAVGSRTGDAYGLGLHQVGGRPLYFQDPPAKYVVRGMAWVGPDQYDEDRWQAVKDQVDDWRLVMQIDSDDRLGVMWADAGTLFWMAHKDDIAAGRWDKGQFSFQHC